MCYVVLRQLLIVVVIITVKGTGLPKVVDLRFTTCAPRCQDPRPRSVVLAQEIQILEDTIPYMTTLLRCEGSGCCTKGLVCRVASWEILNATVFVKDRTTNKYVTRYYEIKSHKECSCQSSSDTPK